MGRAGERGRRGFIYRNALRRDWFSVYSYDYSGEKITE